MATLTLKRANENVTGAGDDVVAFLRGADDMVVAFLGGVEDIVAG